MSILESNGFIITVVRKENSFMKYISLLSFVIFILTACKKTELKNSCACSTSIVGKWELRQSQAGMIPTINYPAANGNILVFTETNFEFYANGQLIDSGQYTMTGDPSVRTEVCLTIKQGEFENRIVYNGLYNAQKIFFNISGNKLVFLSGCFALDGGIRKEYERE